jgi:hypothetical protein
MQDPLLDLEGHYEYIFVDYQPSATFISLPRMMSPGDIRIKFLWLWFCVSRMRRMEEKYSPTKTEIKNLIRYENNVLLWISTTNLTAVLRWMINMLK